MTCVRHLPLSNSNVLRMGQFSRTSVDITRCRYSYGAEKNGYTKAISDAVKKRNAKILGEFGCFGFNTFGPFKWIGGIAKGHPDATDIENVLSFYGRL